MIQTFLFQMKTRVLMVSRKVLVEGGIYHITQRAPGKEVIFVEEADYLRFLKLLKESSKKFSLDIFCFSLLSNHLHILLRTEQRNLDKAMKFLFQSYAQFFNKKYERKGHVFCGVYRASFCQDESYLIVTSLYIHLNPYKAGLTKNIFEYKWFSLQPYIRPIKSSLLNPGFILDILALDRGEARKIYKELIGGSSSLKYENILENKGAIKTFYKEFTSWLKKGALKMFFKRRNPFYSYFELEKKIEEIKKGNLKLNSPQSKEGIRYIIEQLKSRGYTIYEIANILGIGRATLYRLVQN